MSCEDCTSKETCPVYNEDIDQLLKDNAEILEYAIAIKSIGGLMSMLGLGDEDTEDMHQEVKANLVEAATLQLAKTTHVLMLLKERYDTLMEAENVTRAAV